MKRGPIAPPQQAMTNRSQLEAPAPFRADVLAALGRFGQWLTDYGESSFGHQSCCAGPSEVRAKSLYYGHKLIGTMAVAPMILCESLIPSARRLFHHKARFPIAGTHFATRFGKMYEVTGGGRD